MGRNRTSCSTQVTRSTELTIRFNRLRETQVYKRRREKYVRIIFINVSGYRNYIILSPIKGKIEFHTHADQKKMRIPAIFQTGMLPL